MEHPHHSISIHAPREGSDRTTGHFKPTHAYFNPRSPRGERPQKYVDRINEITFQSTLPARGATPGVPSLVRSWRISIHAPREGSDHRAPSYQERRCDFNPRSPRGERRAETAVGHHYWRISIHAPREGSDDQHPDDIVLAAISIHAPREGSDSHRISLIIQQRDFNPRSPRGERHAEIEATFRLLPISIHAPREGSDPSRSRRSRRGEDFNPRSPRGERPRRASLSTKSSYFNPRSPRGERRSVVLRVSVPPVFQSTLPARGATCRAAACADGHLISIHAPREGSDKDHSASPQIAKNFNPRSPRGERPAPRTETAMRGTFQSTLPARGATYGENPYSDTLIISIHAPREGSDRRSRRSPTPPRYFNPRSPRGERRDP